MRKYLDANASIPLTCPSCHKKFSKTLRDIDTDPNLSCPGCGVGFEANDLARALDEIEKGISKLTPDFTINIKL